MSQEALTVLIAESTRLGTHVLEKMLDPYLTLQICRDDPALNQALAQPATPRLCLISYLWPEIEVLLEQLSSHEPPIPAVLLASPDSDAEVLARLSDSHGCGILYRPYEPTQVIREVLRQIGQRQDIASPESALPPVLSSDVDATDAIETEELPDQENSLAILARDQAFCRRHRLPHSILAIIVQDLDNLQRELGDEVCDDAQAALVNALQEKLREEDTLILSDREKIVITLPGTPPLGARVLAHRLCSWLQREEFRIHEFRIHFTIAVGIHSLAQDGNEDAAQALEESLDTALHAHASARSSAVHLSDTASEQAMHHVHETEEETAPEPEPEQTVALDENATIENSDQLWETVVEILTQQHDGSDSDHRSAVISRLTETLKLLDENERMALVDELLLASSLP